MKRCRIARTSPSARAQGTPRGLVLPVSGVEAFVRISRTSSVCATPAHPLINGRTRSRGWRATRSARDVQDLLIALKRAGTLHLVMATLLINHLQEQNSVFNPFKDFIRAGLSPRISTRSRRPADVPGTRAPAKLEPVSMKRWRSSRRGGPWPTRSSWKSTADPVLGLHPQGQDSGDHGGLPGQAPRPAPVQSSARCAPRGGGRLRMAADKRSCGTAWRGRGAAQPCKIRSSTQQRRTMSDP